MPKKKIDADRIDELKNNPVGSKIIDGDKSDEFLKAQDREIKAKKTQVFREELAIKKSEKDAKGHAAWSALGEALSGAKKHYNTTNRDPDILIFEMAELAKLFGDALVHTSFLNLDILAFLPEQIRPDSEKIGQWRAFKEEVFSQRISNFTQKIIPYTALAIGTVATLSALGVVDYKHHKEHGIHFWQGETPYSLAGKAPYFQYSVGADANGELTTSLTKNGEPLTNEEAHYGLLYDAALVGWLKSRGYEEQPDPAGGPPSFARAGIPLTQAGLDDLNAPGGGQNLGDFIQEKLSVHMTEEAEPPAPRP